MSDSMVERVARAISPFPYFSMLPEEQEHWCKVARAAIEATREPTQEMLLAGIQWMGDAAAQVAVRKPYTAMIDAALKE